MEVNGSVPDYDLENPYGAIQYCAHYGRGSFPGNTPVAVAYVASLWGGSIGGIVLGVLVISLVSMPLCCGVLKHYRKALGSVGIVLGTVAVFIPLVVALASCASYVDGLCEDLCGTGSRCEYQYKGIWTEECLTYGIVHVYVVVFGWAACISGISGVILAVFLCCNGGWKQTGRPEVDSGMPTSGGP